MEEAVQEEITESEESPQESEDLISLPDASDEQLEAILKGELEVEAEEEVEEVEENQELEPSQDETDSPETPDPPSEKEETKEQEPTPQKPAVDPEYVKKLEKRLADSQEFIKRRNDEIGRERKEKEALLQKLAGLTENDSFLEDPRKAMEAHDALKKTEQEIEDLNTEQEVINRQLQSQQTVAAHVAPEHWDVNEMIECLRVDGAPPEHLQAFAANPFEMDPTGGVLLVQLSRRAALSKAVKQLVPYMKAQQAKNEELERQLKEKPQKLMKAVEKNLRTPTTLTASNGGGGAVRGKDFDPASLPSLSNEELDQLLKEAS